MLKRVISGAILIILVTIVLYINNPLLYNIVIFLISILGLYELYKAFKNIGFKPMEWIGYLSCVILIFIGGVLNKDIIFDIVRTVVPIILILIFCYMLAGKNKRNIVDVALTIFSVLYVPFMFSFIKFITLLDKPDTIVNEGVVVLIFGLIAGFATDTFAYIIGNNFGKNKLCPEISPNKTVEGSIGGLAGSIVCILVFTIVLKYIFNIDYNILYMLIVSIVASIAGQLGDLTASAIKRYTKVKDFGKIIPGHGGILDRLDSIIFIMPIIYIFMK